MSENFWTVGDKVTYRGKLYTIVAEAKPLEFDVGCYENRRIELVATYDAIEGDDPDSSSFDLDYIFRVRGYDLKAR